MHAHFERHVYHRHSHESYSFGVTEAGHQGFRCRGGSHTSVPGMVLAFNPDDPHDGHPADTAGFTYRIVHIGPDLVRAVLTDANAGRGRTGLPLFADPLVNDPVLAAALRRLHAALLSDGATSLRRDEALTGAILAMSRRGATRAAPWTDPERSPTPTAARVRTLLHERLTDDITAADLATAAGTSRFAVYRTFHAAYGMSPSDYQRQLRLREARRLIAQGTPLAQAATEAGFADQSHLTRWFTRHYGITPATYGRATGEPG
ncbi:MAG: helix-turn-helix domain-containing protein [Streptosporangiales bacterium]|nr:helix-turn-helix domain-containing protein [Streptosporangiales bacterium]